MVVYEPCVQYNVSFAEIFEQNNHEWPSEADPKWPVSKCIGESNFFSNRVLQLLTSDYIRFFDKPCVNWIILREQNISLKCFQSLEQILY